VKHTWIILCLENHQFLILSETIRLFLNSSEKETPSHHVDEFCKENKISSKHVNIQFDYLVFLGSMCWALLAVLAFHGNMTVVFAGGCVPGRVEAPANVSVGCSDGLACLTPWI